MKKLIIVLLTICLSLSLLSQDLRVGLEFSDRKTVFSNSLNNKDNLYLNKKAVISTRIDFPSALLSINYTTKNNLTFGSGIGVSFVNYAYIIKDKKHVFEDGWSHTFLFKAISIPLNIGYKYNIANNFYLKYSLGPQFCFYFDTSSGSEGLIGSYSGETLVKTIFPEEEGLKQTYSILLSNSLNIGYELKNRFYFEIFAAYHTGFKEIINHETHCKYRNHQPEEFVNIAKSKGTYLNIGLGVGYIFNKK